MALLATQDLMAHPDQTVCLERLDLRARWDRRVTKVTLASTGSTASPALAAPRAHPVTLVKKVSPA